MFADLHLRPCRRRPAYSSTGSIRIRRQLEIEPLEQRQLLAAAPQIFLTATVLASLQQQAIANTAQWQAFKAKLDTGLAVVPGNAYQGSELQAIADYTLGYQVLQTINPVTAANYADKAIALIKSGLFDYQKDGSITRQFLARGNGTTTTFTLPNANLIPSSLHVYLAPVTTQAVVHGATKTQDSIGFYLKVLKVSNTPDGNPDYLEGIDWFRNSNLSEDLIDWSLPGKEPAPGATYYVTSTDSMNAPPTKFTLSGHTITLPTAPTTGQAVYVEYVYGTRASNYSTLAYQMTSAGDGGFNSVLVDATYTYRYLGPYLAMGLDWLDSYPGFAATLKSQVINMLIRWSNYIRDFGYNTNSPASNYGDGDYEGRVMTALALLHRDPAGPSLLTEVLNYRQTYVIPTLTNGSPSLRGGYIEEGWSYGQNAAQALLLGSLALEAAGQIPTAGAERQWASQAIYSLISAQPTSTTLYDGGDWYIYPSYLPDNRLFDVLAYMANDPTAQSYANYIIQNRPTKTKHVFLDVLFQNLSAPASFWRSFPLQYYADGTGLVTARADWSYQSTWLAFQLGNLLASGHQSYAPGQLQIQRGGDDLLINANAPGGNQNLATKSSFSNLIAINDNGAGLLRWPWNMGVWYGNPGVFISNYEATGNYVYVGGDYRAAYSSPNNPGGGGPATQLTRQVVYLRPDFIIVHDRAGTLLTSYPKQLQWHFLNPPTVTGNSWVETAGSSSLFGDTFSSVPLTTTTYPVVDAGATIYRVATNNTNPALNVQYTTALETAPSSVTSMVGSRQVVSTNGTMEGVQMGNDLVLFGTTGPLNPFIGPITYTVNGAGSVLNLLTDLQPNLTYRIQVNGRVLTTLISSAQGTLSFTTPAGTTAVTVTTTGVGVGNPVPSISTLDQTSAVEGAGSLVLTVNGSGFVSSSVVQWNGTPLATTFVSSTQLKATVPAVDLAEEGTGNITVVNPSPGGGTSAAISFAINDAALTASGVAVTATEGISFSGQVATFTDANATAPFTDFTTGSGGVTITWGDGTSSAGTVSQPGGVGTPFVVNGGHTYSDQGSYTVTVAIADLGGSTQSVTAAATVADATLTATGSPIQVGPGVPFSGKVATFTDANPSAPLSDFTTGSGGASINWGDGTPNTSGTITQPGGVGSQFVVTGSHTYLTPGSHTVTVTIKDTGGSTVTTLAGSAIKDEIVGRVQQTGQWWVGISTGTSFNNSLWGTWDPSVTWVDVHSGDFVGTGKTEIAGRNAQTGQWWVAANNGSSEFTTTPWTTWSTAVTWVDVQVGDFNGDGKADLIGRVAGTGQWWVALSTGSSFTTTFWDNWSSAVTWVDARVGDFNGDGKSDIAARVLESGQWWIGLSTGSSFNASLWATWSTAVTWVDVKVGDFNGDGKSDITGRVLQTGQWWTSLSTGKEFLTNLWATWNPAVTWVDVEVGDFNGDGKEDLIGRPQGSGDWWVALSTGSGFNATLWASWNPAISWDDVQVGDFNGDGKDDITGRDLLTGNWWTGLSTGTSFNSSVWATWSPTVTWVDVQKGIFV